MLAARRFLGGAKFLSACRFYSGGASKCPVPAEPNNEKLNTVTLNAVTAAQQISSDVSVLVLGSNCQSVVDEISSVEGVSNVLYNDQEAFNRLLPESVSPVLEQCQKEQNFTHILAPATANGKNILPRFGAVADVQPISDVTKIESENTFVRPIYAGSYYFCFFIDAMQCTYANISKEMLFRQ